MSVWHIVAIVLYIALLLTVTVFIAVSLCSGVKALFRKKSKETCHPEIGFEIKDVWNGTVEMQGKKKDLFRAIPGTQHYQPGDYFELRGQKITIVKVGKKTISLRLSQDSCRLCTGKTVRVGDIFVLVPVSWSFGDGPTRYL